MPSAPTKNANSSNIAEVYAVLFVNGPTKSVAAQSAILDALASDPETAPTNGSLNDRKRAPFSSVTLAADAGTKIGSPIFWRMKSPKYWGMVDASPQPIARILLKYEDFGPRAIRPVWSGVARLVDRLQPGYVLLHFRWINPIRDHAASMNGMATKALEYSRSAPPGVFACTWFRPELVARSARRP